MYVYKYTHTHTHTHMVQHLDAEAEPLLIVEGIAQLDLEAFYAARGLRLEVFDLHSVGVPLTWRCVCVVVCVGWMHVRKYLHSVCMGVCV